jgi:hypothetical protein
MTTTTQHGQITLPTSELRQILAVLDEYTTSDKTRHVMTLAQVRPIIVEQTPNDETPPTALEWQATDSYALVSITQRVQHTLTEPALIDPAALLAALPKKADTSRTAETVLSLTPDAWQLTTGHNTTTGTTQTAGIEWPNTWGLWKDQKPEVAPHSMASWQHERLGKTGKHLAGKEGARIELATMRNDNGQPNPNAPVVYVITTGHTGNQLDTTTRVLLMPQRKQ